MKSQETAVPGNSFEMAKRLQKHLISLPTASVDFYEDSHSRADDSIVDIDFSDINTEDIEDDDKFTNQ